MTKTIAEVAPHDHGNIRESLPEKTEGDCYVVEKRPCRGCPGTDYHAADCKLPGVAVLDSQRVPSPTGDAKTNRDHYWREEYCSD